MQRVLTAVIAAERTCGVSVDQWATVDRLLVCVSTYRLLVCCVSRENLLPEAEVHKCK